ncbi:MAG TPA: hypothetical protein VGR28_13165 [Candidatus Thermoplasmatota archaeon]|jgi:hypothetical protein|nr:hypothetical protein [Candidatus Thermoplasmatota archaeon]
MRALPLGLAALAIAASVALPMGIAGVACPAADPLKLVQNDAGSGRDAGDTPAGAVPVGADGWQWGFVEGPAPALESGLEDLHDWFYADVPPGPHDVTTRVVAQVNHDFFNDANQVVLLFWLEVFHEGEASPFYEAAVWYPPFTFQADGERVLLHVYFVPLLIQPLCQGQEAGPAVAPLPPEAQTYGAFFACAPLCNP